MIAFARYIFLVAALLSFASCSRKPALVSDGLREERAKAESGDASAQYQMAEIYTSSQLGVDRDYVEAVKWYRKAAEQNHAEAQIGLGRCYANGNGVDKDYAEAVKWYRKAAEQGNAIAQVNLGYMYENGRGVTKDEAEAVSWYLRAAEQGNAKAQANLGNRYAYGRGVTKDEVEAAKWYRKAAEQGDAWAQVNLGYMYENGRGVTKDEVEAVKWYRKGAERGDAQSQYNLGLMYAQGMGVTKDEVEAVKWYRNAAGQGSAQAQYSLGFMYANGLGLAKNNAEAYKWWLLAAAQGVEDAKKAYPNLERILTTTQRADGQRTAREFIPKKWLTQGEAAALGFVPPGVNTLEVEQQPKNSPASETYITSDVILLLETWVLLLLALSLADVHLLASRGLLSQAGGRLMRFALAFLTAVPVTALVMFVIGYVPVWYRLFNDGGVVSSFYLSILQVGVCLGLLVKLFWTKLVTHLPLVWLIRLHQQRAVLFATCVALVFTVLQAPWRIKHQEQNQVFQQELVFNSILSVPVVSNRGYSQIVAEIAYPVLFIEWLGIVSLAGLALFVTRSTSTSNSISPKP